MVQNNLCTPKNGTILVASTQDFLTSSFLITRKDTFYDRGAFSLLCSYMGDGMDIIDLPTPALIKPIELWTGKQLFSIQVRPHSKMRVFVNLLVKEKIFSKIEERKVYCQEETMCPNDGFVYFRNSELISGQVGKATLGNGNKVGLFAVLLRDYEAHAAAACMNRLAKLSARWIGNHGFSIGIDDVQPGKVLEEHKRCTISGTYEECERLIKSCNEGKLTLIPGCDAAQTLEAKMTQDLSQIRDTAGKICMKELHWRNSPLIMSQCGSKGSPINISQMVVCVGQQTVSGSRAPDGFIDRSLPHFPRKSNTPAGKGFVANSFYSGLTATEFFFHTMGGREGLVDTAVKTADTGYMSRRLMKCLEDLAVYYDMTVRDSSGNIVQFTYGDDGMDPGQMEGGEGFPLDLERLLFKVEATCRAGKNLYLNPKENFDTLNKKLSEYNIRSQGSCSDAFKQKLVEFFAKLEGKKRSVSEQQLQVFLDGCISRLRSKGIEPGTAIGAIGAQSIGEPGTQMTLKTFHFAGVASMNVTLGVPRMKEIIAASKKIATPVITAIFEDESDKATAQIIKGQIEKTTLGQVANIIQLELTAVRGCVIAELDMPLIVSLKLGINVYTVKSSIEKYLAKGRNSDKLSVKILDDVTLAVMPEAGTNEYHFAVNRIKEKLKNVIVKGIDTIERAIVAQKEHEKEKISLMVEGTGLREVMGIPGINGYKTATTHIIEMHQTLGIEAARHSIITEINKVMKSHGMDIDIRHMMLLADMMTSKGIVLAVTRTGIQHMKESVMMLASFEKTEYHLYNASVNGREDKIEGVSECIIMGIPVQVGTGMMKIRQRADYVPSFKYALDPIAV